MKKKRTYKEAVDLMIQWWIDKAFNNSPNQKNGDSNQELLMNFGAGIGNKSVTPEKIEKFRASLSEYLLANELSKKPFMQEFDVDYNPNKPLNEACISSEISRLCLPIKTFTYIDMKDYSIKGRNGYGAPWFII